MSFIQEAHDRIFDIVLDNPGIPMSHIYHVYATRFPEGLITELQRRFVLANPAMRPNGFRIMNDSSGETCYLIDDQKYQQDTLNISSGASTVKQMDANGELESWSPFPKETPLQELERRRRFKYAHKISKESFLGVQFRRPSPAAQSEMHLEYMDNYLKNHT